MIEKIIKRKKKDSDIKVEENIESESKDKDKDKNIDMLRDLITSSLDVKDEKGLAELELSKIIVQECLSQEHRKKFSDLTEKEIFEIRKALVLNEIFKNKLISDYLYNTLELKMSKNHLMLDKMVEIVKGSSGLVNLDSEKKGIFRFFKR